MIWIFFGSSIIEEILKKKCKYFNGKKISFIWIILFKTSTIQTAPLRHNTNNLTKLVIAYFVLQNKNTTIRQVQQLKESVQILRHYYYQH